MLEFSVEKLPYIKTERGAILKKMGIETVGDILNYFPRTYEDRSNYKKITECADGEKCMIRATVLSKSLKKVRKNLTLIKVLASDDSGRIEITYFNQSYMMDKLCENKEYNFFGKVLWEYGKKTMTNPITEEEAKNTGGITPVYPLKKGMTQNIFINTVKSSLSFLKAQSEDVLPEYIRREHKLCDMIYAYKNIHFPDNFHSLSVAKRRIAFTELLLFELGLLKKKSKSNGNKGIVFDDFKIVEKLAEKLPYELTKAQKRVVRDIARDIRDKKQLNRLVQGDVGSGKTMVALCAVLMAINSGYQAAMMAPTEILAIQHYEEMNKYLSMFGYKTALITGSTPKKEKQELLSALKEGNIDFLIGTHAIIEENVEFKNLAMCVVDEQHRFGVNQRGKLYGKGENPHFLVMSATPIPRTLALIMYSDLDVSVIDELPPGRKEIKTVTATGEDRNKINSFLLERLKNDEQIYIVCPLVEESDAFDEDMKNVVEYTEIIKKEFKDYNVSLLHGKMKNKEKDEIMLAFKNKEINILVSTTVIEVGVNVPSATVMLIENAERFGLSQLHQLRGRVGRGDKQSYNILVSDNGGKNTKERLEIMAKTNDGFKISEVDLKMRGPGDFFGTAQSGFIDSKIAQFITDVKLVNEVMETAKEILENDPELKDEKHKLLRENANKMFLKYKFNL